MQNVAEQGYEYSRNMAEKGLALAYDAASKGKEIASQGILLVASGQRVCLIITASAAMDTVLTGRNLLVD